MRLPLCTSIFLLAVALQSTPAQQAAPVAPAQPTAPSAVTAPVAPAAPLAPAAPTAPAPAPFEPLPIPAPLQLQTGETWLFLGDSITHQCLYTQYVEDYVYTRFPKARVHFYNAGVSGDRAQDALNRWEGDVAAQKPTYVTILLGMNDGSYTNFQQPIFDNYQKGMTTILDKLAEMKAVAFPMTPTMFDSRADMLKANQNPNPVKDTYYNGVLSLYGSWLREQANARGLGFVDMWAPLNNLTRELRRQNARFTFINDAVHPGPGGQVIMAEAIINDVLEPAALSRISIGVEGGQPSAKAEHGQVSEVAKSEQGVSFTFLADALPWVLPPDTADGVNLTHAHTRYSSEMLAVRDLAPGQYEVKIDGQSVGTYSAAGLGVGIPLEGNAKTPQYQQASQVAALNKQRNDQAVRPLRDLWGQLKGKRNALARMEASKAPDLEVQRVAFQQQMPAFEAKTAELINRANQLEEQIYQGNQPTPHKYEIVALK